MSDKNDKSDQTTRETKQQERQNGKSDKNKRATKQQEWKTQMRLIAIQEVGTSSNTIFTLRPIQLSVRQKLEVDSGRKMQ